MARLKEKNKDDKEEVLEFVDVEEESNNIRMLGCYMGWKKDVDARCKRAGMSWSRVKRRLKGRKLYTRAQARIVEVVVDSTMFFGS